MYNKNHAIIAWQMRMHGWQATLKRTEEFFAAQSERFVEEAFEGSLPAFLAAFTKRKSLSREEVAELRALIESFEEET